MGMHVTNAEGGAGHPYAAVTKVRRIEREEAPGAGGHPQPITILLYRLTFWW